MPWLPLDVPAPSPVLSFLPLIIIGLLVLAVIAGIVITARALIKRNKDS